MSSPDDKSALPKDLLSQPPQDFLKSLKQSERGPLLFDYHGQPYFEWEIYSHHAEASLRSISASESLAESSRDRLIKQRQEKDALQDAWLDHFLIATQIGCRGDYRADRTAAERYMLFESLQKFLNDRGAGQVDIDILQRLRYRERLLKRRRKPRSRDDDVPDFISNAQDFLQSRLTALTNINPRESALSASHGPMQGQLLHSLSDALTSDRKATPFALGGIVQVKSKQNALEANEASASSPEAEAPRCMFRIWWDTEHSRGALDYPPISWNAYNAKLEKLAEACRPALLGKGNVNILDETYRKAGAMNVENFITDFCPLKFGIIDHVQRVLSSYKRGSITCELYKLNTYSTPGGKFRSHIDTPRGEGHFGSLVICLPGNFKGGELVVHHEDRTHTFTWKDKGSKVQWAAFFSDCEHEVLEVTEGQRVTLTYNLFWSASKQPTTTEVMSSNASFSKKLKEALSMPAFLNQGAILGVPCSHYYAHNRSYTERIFEESNLKGVDRVLLQTLRDLGLEKCVSVVLKNGRDTYGGLSIDEFCNGNGIEEPHDDDSEPERKRFRYHFVPSSPQGDASPPLRLEYVDEYEMMSEWSIWGSSMKPTHLCYLDISPCERMSLEERIEMLRLRKVKWVDTEYLSGGDIVVTHHPYEEQEPDGEWENRYDDVIDNIYSHSRLRQVVWLQKPQSDHTEGLQTTYTAYGNEATTEWRYSQAAILFIVPSWSKRSAERST